MSMKVDDDRVAVDRCREDLRGLAAYDARAAREVELPQVVDAAERFAAKLAVDEWVPRVRARVFERVHPAADAEERELATVHRDERTIAAAEDLERNTVGQAA